MIIAVDFDGTCVTHEYPKVGTQIGAAPVLKRLIAAGHQLILFTMRSEGRDDSSNPLADAVQWFMDNEIPLLGINTNPTQQNWTQSPKAYAQLYIDDAALGIPLRKPAGVRPYVCWKRVEWMLEEEGILPRMLIKEYAINTSTD